MALRLQNVCCRYGGDGPVQITAVQDINLTVEQGELVGLVGHTGSGKSTLAQLICGLIAADGGEIWLDDLCLTGRKRPRAADLARHVGMVFQYPEHQLFAETVAQELAYGPENLGWPAEQIQQAVQELAGRLSLTEQLNSSPYQLSGGEKRKVALASVLIMQPPLLVLDEPFVGLDALARQDFLRLLLAWQQANNSTIICISHDIDLLAGFCRRLVLLQGGRLRLDKPIREAFDEAELLEECGVRLPLARQAVLAAQARGWQLPAPGLSALTLAEAAAALKGAKMTAGQKVGEEFGR